MTVVARLVFALVLAAGMVGGGLALDRGLGPRALPDAPPTTTGSGASYCPHGGGEGWRAWVVLANPSEAPIDVRITTSAGGAPPQASEERLEPTTSRFVEVAAPLPGTATTVESFGGEIAAGTVVSVPEAGVAAEPCATDAGTRWMVPETSTLRGEDARIVVQNPFAAEAVFDVTLIAAARQLRPGRLQGVVLEPGESRAISVQNYALGLDALGVTVDVPLGRVVVAGVTVSRGGVRAALGVQRFGAVRFLPGLGVGGDVVLRSPPATEVPFHVELESAEGSSRLIDLEAVPAGTTGAFATPNADGGLVVGVDDRPGDLRTMLAGRRMEPAPPPPPPKEEEPRRGARDRRQGGQGQGGRQGEEEEEASEPPPALDVASTAGVPEAASRWVALPAVGADGGEGTLLVENPRSTPVDATVTFLGPDGPVGEAETVTVAASSTLRVALPEGPPVAAIVDAGEGRIVVAQAATSPTAFAVSVGVPTLTEL